MIEQTTFLIAAAVALLFLAVLRKQLVGKRLSEDAKRATKRRERRLRKRRTLRDRRTTIRNAEARRKNGGGRRPEDQWESRVKF
jgi:hypothetical protein